MRTDTYGESTVLRFERLLCKHVTLSSVLIVAASGCAGWRGRGEQASLKSLLQPKIEQAKFEESYEELPEKLSNPARVKLSYARWMEEVGQLTEARNNYASVIDEEPKNVEAILGLARIDQLSGNFGDAERRYAQALKLTPNNPVAQNAFGQFLGSQGRWQEAVVPLQNAMLNAPVEKQYRHHLAVALVHTGDIDSALPHFSQTVGDAEAHYNVALILREMGELQQAEQQLVMALTKKPDMEPAQRWLAELRRQRDTTVDAAASALRVSPASAMVGTAHATQFVTQASGRSEYAAKATLPEFESPVRGTVIPSGHSHLAIVGEHAH